jgi:hypothetical protein
VHCVALWVRFILPVGHGFIHTQALQQLLDGRDGIIDESLRSVPQHTHNTHID